VEFPRIEMCGKSVVVFILCGNISELLKAVAFFPHAEFALFSFTLLDFFDCRIDL
jgi:hypothetical protein